MTDFKSLLHTAVGSYRSPETNGSNGAKGLAPMLGLTPSIVSRKSNPNDDKAHFNADELVTVFKATGDHSALIAMAMELGYVLMPLQNDAAGDLSSGMGKTFKETADWLQAASAINASPRPTANQIEEARRELFESIAESVRMFSALQARHQAQQPSHLRAA